MQVLPTDGPLACIWKVMQDKGWMSMRDISTALKGHHYSEGRIRTIVYAATGTLLERKEEPYIKKHIPRVLYRLIPDIPMPTDEKTMPTKKQRQAKWGSDVRRVRRMSYGSPAHYELGSFRGSKYDY